MTPPAWPPVLVDEDYPVPVSRALRERGLASVESVAEGPLRGADDRTVVARAASAGSVLLSHNKRHQGKFRGYVRAWRRQGNDTVCVLLLPRDADDERLLLRTLLLLTWYVGQPHPKPETLIWNDAAQALIHGYRPAGFDSGQIRYVLGQAAPDPPGNSVEPSDA